MNILFYCPEYPPAKNGGIGSVTKIVAEGLVNRGHKVFVVGSYRADYPYLGSGEHPKYQIINGVEIYSLFHFTYIKLLDGIWLRAIRRLYRIFWVEDLLSRRAIRKVEDFIKKLVKLGNIDVVEFPDYYNLLVPLKKSIKLKKFNAPTVLRVHGSNSFVQFYRQGHIPEITKINDTNHFNRCDLILSVSDFSKSFMEDQLSIGKPNKVIYNPIEDSMFNRILTSPTNNHILFFGTVSEGKGVFSLLKAFNRVVAEFPQIQLIVVGAGDIDNSKQYLTSNSINNVQFKGFLPKEEVLKEIQNAYICVLPSYFENFSMAALEVLASGRTLIYTNRCSGPELIEDFKNGILINPDDDREIADRIIYLLRNPVINNAISKQGYTDCRNRFSESVILSQLEEEYQMLINS